MGAPGRAAGLEILCDGFAARPGSPATAESSLDGGGGRGGDGGGGDGKGRRRGRRWWPR
jgi:hypothetical protein